MNLKELVRDDKRIAELLDVNVGLAKSILSMVDSDGKLLDEVPDMSTHHLILVLSSWRNPSFDKIEENAIRWFSTIDDPRETKVNDFNPFKLLAFAASQKESCRPYLDKKIPVLRKYKRTADGFVVLQLGFTMAGDVQHVFPTLMGVNILLLDGSDESLEIARRSLDWCRRQMTADVVYENKNSINGFAALMTTWYESLSGDQTFSNWRDSLIAGLVKAQKDGIWEGSLYQSAYIFYDLAHISHFLDREDVRKAASSFAEIVNDVFFKSPEIAGQNALLVFCSLLRAFSYILTKDQRSEVAARAVADSITNYSAYNFARMKVEAREEELRIILKGFDDGMYLHINPPLFTTRETKANTKLVFVLMPFGEKEWRRRESDGTWQNEKYDFDPAYFGLVVPAVEELGLECKRADDLYEVRPVMQKIWSQILQAKLLIADLTSANPNVLYELGIGHTLGKPIILITQDMKYVPTDLKALECVTYEAQLGKEKEFRTKLKKSIQDVIGVA
jgi:hypothetical protein